MEKQTATTIDTDTLAEDIAEGALSAGLLDVWAEGHTYTLTREDCEWLADRGVGREDYAEIERRITHLVSMAYQDAHHEDA